MPLINGFGEGQPIITKATVDQAVADIDGRPVRPLVARRHLVASTAILGFLVLLMLPVRSSHQASSVASLIPELSAPVPIPLLPISPERKQQPTTDESSKDHVIPTETAAPSHDPPPLSFAVLPENGDAAETARLLAVLLDCGRVVVGRAQPAINNPRLEDKGFSASAFESYLRKEFLARTGHDLRNLATAPMPDRAKSLLVRLVFFMKKAVQDVQPDINKKGIGFKGFIPATFATQVAQAFSQDTGVKVRQIGPPGVEPRNPDNKPDEQEEQALLAMQRSHPRAGDHVIEDMLPDNRVRVLLPLFYTKACLACHGKPKGQVDISGYEKEGFKEGDLGGAISVALPVDSGALKGVQSE